MQIEFPNNSKTTSHVQGMIEIKRVKVFSRLPQNTNYSPCVNPLQTDKDRDKRKCVVGTAIVQKIKQAQVEAKAILKKSMCRKQKADLQETEPISSAQLSHNSFHLKLGQHSLYDSRQLTVSV
eukprot:TRINITY_DN10435_c0_g1_i2.p7 TRINITY_DN10435_c0_g1~~TRINITY_DN10435_c0_g1_i2.p7  ORF type:complete len:123 (+),score=1.89 TRINITY_DN10435_c0_g1_i2:1264-1632(+)